jgi:hypothetical protein
VLEQIGRRPRHMEAAVKAVSGTDTSRVKYSRRVSVSHRRCR